MSSRGKQSITIDLANNKLKEIKALKNLKQLKKLDLGANRIRVMAEEELSGLENLEELWIGKNKIEKIEGLEKVCWPSFATKMEEKNLSRFIFVLVFVPLVTHNSLYELQIVNEAATVGHSIKPFNAS